MSDRKHIEDLVREKLGDAEIAPSDGAWEGIRRQLRVKQFLRFDPGRFNVFYLGGTVIAVGALVALLAISGQRGADPVPPESLSPERPVLQESPPPAQGQAAEAETARTGPVAAPDNPGAGQQARPGKGNEARPEATGQQALDGETGEVGPGGDRGGMPMEVAARAGDEGVLDGQSPVARFTASATTGCAPLGIRFTSSCERANAVRWSFGTGETSSEPDPHYLFTEPGAYRVRLTALGSGGVYRTTEQTIRVYPSPRANFEVVEKTGTEGRTEGIELVNYSEGAGSYSWELIDAGDMPTGSWSSMEFQPAIGPGDTRAGDTRVRLVVQNEHGCRDTVAVEIPLVVASGEPTIRFPNAFSPSLTGPSGGIYEAGERRRDLFYPVFTREPADYRLQIYSRLGELVYETENIYRGWDGYHMQQPAAGGVYIWIASGRWDDGATFHEKGDLTLIWEDQWP